MTRVSALKVPGISSTLACPVHALSATLARAEKLLVEGKANCHDIYRFVLLHILARSVLNGCAGQTSLGQCQNQSLSVDLQ